MCDCLVSVIVPVYNACSTLKGCIASVLSQTYKNIELLLIDDGSSDDSYRICRLAAQKDTRVKAFTKQNEGVSKTRNFGICHSKGKYIAFVDSDDWIDNDYIEKLVSRIEEKNSDLAFASEKKYHGTIVNQTVQVERYDGDIQVVLYDLIATFALFQVWGKLFKAKIIIENDIHFNSNYSKGEDFNFVLIYCRYINKISQGIETFYNYRLDTEKSLSKKQSQNEFKALDENTILLLELSKDNSKLREIKTLISSYKKDVYVKWLRYIVNSEETKKLSKIAHVVKSDEFCNMAKHLSCVSPKNIVLKTQSPLIIYCAFLVERHKRGKN